MNERAQLRLDVDETMTTPPTEAPARARELFERLGGVSGEPAGAGVCDECGLETTRRERYGSAVVCTSCASTRRTAAARLAAASAGAEVKRPTRRRAAARVAAEAVDAERRR
jgi:hypothetical protein